MATNKRKRTSTNKIEEHLSKHKFISNEQFEYFLLNDYSEAEIFRRGLNRGRRSMRHGLFRIKKDLFEQLVFFRIRKVQKTEKGYHIED
jgi:hypothetical protein